MQNNLIWLVLTYVNVIFSMASPVKQDSEMVYDQRQTGKYNIHVSIKDVAIIALGKNDMKDNDSIYSDEYYYDDNDLTIKPISWYTSTVKTTTTANSTSSAENSSEEKIKTTTKSSTASMINSTTQEPSIQNSTGHYTTIPSTTKKQNVVIMSTGTPSISNETSDANKTEERSPFRFVAEPILTPKLRTGNKPFQRISDRLGRPILRVTGGDSQIYHLNTRQALAKKCFKGQVLDERGHCRSKRSSFLEKLLSMLSSIKLDAGI